VTSEGPGSGKFSQPVSNHILGNQDRYMPPAVMNTDGQPDHLRQIVDARDQVLIMVFCPERPTASTFFNSFGSIAGPFLVDLDIIISPYV